MEDLLTYISFFVYLFIIVWLINIVKLIIHSIIKKEKIELADLSLFGEKIKEKPVVSSLIAVGILALVLYSNNTFTELVGIQKPLSKRDAGTYCYYVEANEESTGKEYVVPAKIEVEKWLEDEGDGKTSGSTSYYVKELFFDNGTTIIFDDYEEASFDYFTNYNDSNWNEWECKLTEKHAYSSSVKETTYIKSSNIIELCVIVSAILINWLAGLALVVQQQKENY